MLAVGQTKVFVSHPCVNLDYPQDGRPSDACVTIINKTNLIGYICSNECNTFEERICTLNNSYSLCGNYDADTCLEWGNKTQCINNELCVNGACVLEDVEDDCEDECSTNGAKECVGEEFYKTCGYFDNDNCLEWSQDNLCPLGDYGRDCDELTGECVVRFKECHTIGLRDNEKYCSSTYNWADQKAESIGCDSDFECESDNCFNSKCSLVDEGKDYSGIDNSIYWIIGIVLGACIILIVVIILVKSRHKPNPFGSQAYQRLNYFRGT